MSKKFIKTQKNWLTIEQECYTIVQAVGKRDKYRRGRKLILESDHEPLMSLPTKEQVNKRCERWRVKLAEYRHRVKHIRGKRNAMADYLSRAPVKVASEELDDKIQAESRFAQTKVTLTPTADLSFIGEITAAITQAQTKRKRERNESARDLEGNDQRKQLIPQGTKSRGKEDVSSSMEESNKVVPFRMNHLREEQNIDSIVRTIKQDLKKQKQPFPSVPYVPAGRMRSDVLQIYHDTSTNGPHFGRDKPTQKIQGRYFWPGMISNIANHVNSCLPCAQINSRRQKAPGALKLIPPPQGIWMLLSMDFSRADYPNNGMRKQVHHTAD